MIYYTHYLYNKPPHAHRAELFGILEITSNTIHTPATTDVHSANCRFSIYYTHPTAVKRPWGMPAIRDGAKKASNEKKKKNLVHHRTRELVCRLQMRDGIKRSARFLPLLAPRLCISRAARAGRSIFAWSVERARAIEKPWRNGGKILRASLFALSALLPSIISARGGAQKSVQAVGPPFVRRSGFFLLSRAPGFMICIDEARRLDLFRRSTKGIVV